MSIQSSDTKCYNSQERSLHRCVFPVVHATGDNTFRSTNYYRSRSPRHATPEDKL